MACFSSQKNSFFILLVLVLSGCGLGLTEDELYQRAEKNYELQDFGSSSLDLKNILQENPANAKARLLLGRVHLAMGAGADAEKELLRATEAGVSRGAYTVMLAEAFALQNKADELLALPWQDMSEQHQALMLAFRGDAWLVKQKIEAASEAYSQTLLLDPLSERGLLGVSRVAAIEGDYDLARRHLQQILEINADYLPARLLAGDVEQADGNLNQAIEIYTAILNAEENNRAALLKRATLLVQMQEFDRAQVDLTQLKQVVKQAVAIDYLQGLIDFSRENYEQSANLFEKVLQVNSNHQSSMMALAQARLAMGQLASAEKLFNRYLALRPESDTAATLLAQVHLQKADYAKAEELVRSTYKERDMDLAALMLLANTLLAQNKVDEGVGFLQKAITLSPEVIQPHVTLGGVYLTTGEPHKAVPELEKAVGLEPGNQRATSQLVEAYMQAGDFDKAILVARNYIALQPDETFGHVLLASVFVKQNNLGYANEAFKDALAINPDDISANSGLALLAISEKKLPRARELYNHILGAHPDHVQTLMHLALLEQLAGDSEEAVELFRRAVELEPDDLGIKSMLARVYYDQGKFSNIADLFSSNKKNLSRSPDVLAILAESEYRSGLFQSAKYTLELLQPLRPESPDVYYSVARVEAALNAPEKYIAALKQVLAVDPGHLPARRELVGQYIQNGKLAEAREYLAGFPEEHKNHNEVVFLRARLADSALDYELSVSLYEQLFSEVRTNRFLVFLANAKWKAGDTSEAVRVLEDWLQEYPDDKMVQMELAGRYISLEQNEKAVALYKNLASTGGGWVVLNNLAWLLKDINLEEALEYADKANQMAPDNADVKHTYAMTLLQHGDIASAKTMINKALELDSGNSDYQYNKAVILLQSGEEAQAREILQGLVTGKSEASSSQRASELLRELDSGA